MVVECLLQVVLNQHANTRNVRYLYTTNGLEVRFDHSNEMLPLNRFASIFNIFFLSKHRVWGYQVNARPILEISHTFIQHKLSHGGPCFFRYEVEQGTRTDIYSPDTELKKRRTETRDAMCLSAGDC